MPDYHSTLLVSLQMIMKALEELFLEVKLQLHQTHLKAGESGTSEFVAGEEGIFYYICTVPGHRDQGMVGEIIVGDVTEVPEPVVEETPKPVVEETPKPVVDGNTLWNQLLRKHLNQ